MADRTGIVFPGRGLLGQRRSWSSGSASKGGGAFSDLTPAKHFCGKAQEGLQKSRSEEGSP